MNLAVNINWYHVKRNIKLLLVIRSSLFLPLVLQSDRRKNSTKYWYLVQVLRPFSFKYVVQMYRTKGEVVTYISL